MSRDEIASKLEISRNTVRVHLTRAQRFFREQLNAIGLFLLVAGFNIFCSCIGNTKSAFEDLYNTEEGTHLVLPKENKYSLYNSNKSSAF